MAPLSGISSVASQPHSNNRNYYMESLVTLTERAVPVLREALAPETQSNVGIRIGLKGGGCSGFSWVLLVDEEQETDIISVVEGIKILIDPMSAAYIKGTELDYLTTLTNSGFVFKNDSVLRTCGCGKSVAF